MQIPVPVIKTVTTTAPTRPTGPGWTPVLTTLAAQLQTGRIYDRDLPALITAINQLIEKVNRRTRHRH